MIQNTLDAVIFPAAHEATRLHGLLSIDDRFVEDLNWELILLVLHDRGFVVPGPNVGLSSYWLMTKKYRRHPVAARTILQMLCGLYTGIALNKITMGCLGMPTVLRRWESMTIRRFSSDHPKRGRPGNRKAHLCFRYADPPYGWDRKKPRGRFRLKAGTRLNPWVIPTNRLFRGYKLGEQRP